MSPSTLSPDLAETTVQVHLDGLVLPGTLGVPERATGLVLFAHGSGSSRHSPRNRFVAASLRDAGLGTLLFDLLTPEEETQDRQTGHLRFNVELLAQRLAGATQWTASQPALSHLPIGYFGASTGAAAALLAAARLPAAVSAVVSRGGRPDLAGDALPQVRAPTLLLVGGEDTPVIGLNEFAYQHLGAEKRLDIIPGATHLFEEPGALEVVADRARDWFRKYLVPLPTK